MKIRRKFTHRTARGPVFKVELCSGKKLRKLSPKPRPKGVVYLGLCEQPANGRGGRQCKIFLNDRLRAWDLADIAVHELLHAEFPQFDEEAIKRLERSICLMVRRAWHLTHALARKDKTKGKR